MSDDSPHRGLDRIVGLTTQGRLLYWVLVSPEAVQRAKELAVGGIGPIWEVQTADTWNVKVITEDPEWFLDLDQKVKKTR